MKSWLAIRTSNNLRLIRRDSIPAHLFGKPNVLLVTEAELLPFKTKRREYLSIRDGALYELTRDEKLKVKQSLKDRGADNSTGIKPPPKGGYKPAGRLKKWLKKSWWALYLVGAVALSAGAWKVVSLWLM